MLTKAQLVEFANKGEAAKVVRAARLKGLTHGDVKEARKSLRNYAKKYANSTDITDVDPDAPPTNAELMDAVLGLREEIQQVKTDTAQHIADAVEALQTATEEDDRNLVRRVLDWGKKPVQWPRIPGVEINIRLGKSESDDES
jgi:hypothetical protein